MLLFNGRIKSDISNMTATRAPAVATYVAENVKMSNEKIKVVAVPIRLHQQPHSQVLSHGMKSGSGLGMRLVM